MNVFTMKTVKPSLDIFDDIFDLSRLQKNWLSSPYDRSPRDALVKEYDDRFEISFAAPGASKEDFKISVEDNKINLAYQANDNARHYSFASNYTKSYTLPKNSDVDNITASYENGVLFVAVPKVEASPARIIEIK